MAWTTACPDWRERIVARESLVACEPLYPDKAADALGVFKSLQMTDLPKRADGRWPTMGEVCEPFVFDLVAALFGSQDPISGESQIKEAMLLISKKNGKSTIAAAIMLTALILNWRHGAELLVLAPTIKVASNSFDPAAKMVRADPELSTILKVIEHQRTIKHLDTQAELKIVAADAGTVAGVKAGFVLVDELWLFGKKAGAEAMFEEATGGQASRPEGWTLYLTTHSDESPAGIFKTKLDYFRDVRDGEVVDPTSLPMLYEWPEEMIEAQDYLNPDLFYVTNPNIGKSPTVKFIQRKIDLARAGKGEEGDTTIQIVLAKYLNVEIGLRLARNRWRGADHWEQAHAPYLTTLDDLLDRSEVCTVGIDGGGLDDLLGLVIMGRCRRSKRWMVWARAWIYPSVLKLRQEIAPRLLDFIAQGDLVLCEEDDQEPDADIAVVDADDDDVDDAAMVMADQDLREVADLIELVDSRGLLPEEYAVGVDPAGITALVDEVMGRKAFKERERLMVPISQGWRLTPDIKQSARALKSGKLVHAGQEMLTWCVGNAKAEARGNAILVTKQAAGTAKIDPVIALFNAHHLMARNPSAIGPSVYGERGLLIL